MSLLALVLALVLVLVLVLLSGLVFLWHHQDQIVVLHAARMLGGIQPPGIPLLMGRLASSPRRQRACSPSGIAKGSSRRGEHNPLCWNSHAPTNSQTLRSGFY